MKTLAQYAVRKSLNEALGSFDDATVQELMKLCSKIKAKAKTLDDVNRLKKDIVAAVEIMRQDVCGRYSEVDDRDRSRAVNVVESMMEAVWECAVGHIRCEGIRIAYNWNDFLKTTKWLLPYIDSVFR